jgi:hypothetical protein
MTDVELRGKVRARDRETSWEAASKQTTTRTAALQVRIRDLLVARGPKTDEEIQEWLEFGGLKVTGSGVRTRRHELELAGWVVATGDKRRGSRGSLMTVWRAVTDDEPAPEPREPEPPKVSLPGHVKRLARAQAVGMEAYGLEAEWVTTIIGSYIRPLEP